MNTPVEGWMKNMQATSCIKPHSICDSCETVATCYRQGCLPITMEEPARKWNVLATCFWIAASGICTAFVVAAIRYAT